MFDDSSSIKFRIRNLLIVLLIVSAAIMLTITQKPKHTVTHSNVLEIPIREVHEELPEEQRVPIVGELIQDETDESSSDIEVFSSNEEVSIVTEDTTMSEPEQGVTYNGIIQREGSVSDSLLLSIEYYYCLIPSSIRTSLENNGWQYICSSEDFTGRYGTSHKVLAMTAYDDKIIYIDARDSAKDVIIHEVGHAFDTTQGMLSSSSEFDEIISNADFAFSDGVLYMVCDTHPFGGTILSCVPDASCIYSALWDDNTQSLSNIKWEKLFTVGSQITGFAKNHNCGLYRDVYGGLAKNGVLVTLASEQNDFLNSLCTYRLGNTTW